MTVEQSGVAGFKFVFIAGANYSGSTLLAMLLGSHPQIECLGQLYAVSGDVDSGNICQCGNTLFNCKFWSKVLVETGYWDTNGRRLLPISTEVRRGAIRGKFFGLVMPRSPSHLDVYQNFNQVLLSAASKSSGREILIDSSKIPHRLHWLLETGATEKHEVHVIHLIRNGFGVANSYKRRRYGVLRGSLAWRSRNDQVFKLLSRYPTIRSLRVRYEDICNRPHEALTDVCDFIGVPFTPEMLKFRTRIQHQVGGNPIRHGGSEVIRLDEHWRHNLNKCDRWIFKTVAGNTQKRLGYDLA